MRIVHLANALWTGTCRFVKDGDDVCEIFMNIAYSRIARCKGLSRAARMIGLGCKISVSIKLQFVLICYKNIAARTHCLSQTASYAKSCSAECSPHDSALMDTHRIWSVNGSPILEESRVRRLYRGNPEAEAVVRLSVANPCPARP